MSLPAMKVGHCEAQHDFYDILGVPERAMGVAIRKAHRRLVWELHPDRARGRGDGERIKLVNLAATVLLNPAARARYDELRREAKSGRRSSSRSSPPAWHPANRTRGARSAAYRARARTAATRGPGPLVADEFFRRLVGAALLATLVIACISERARPSDAPGARLRRPAHDAIVYAPDYPRYPVRYAVADTTIE